MLKTIYFCLAILTCAAATLGQQTSTRQTQQDDRVIVGTNLVTLNVIVTDHKGQYVRGLSRDQFTIYDNKVKQQIAHFSADASPVSIGIVCEIHETTPEQTRSVLTAVKEFTRTLGSEDDFFFMAFSERGNLTIDFIPSSDQVLDHLRFVKPGGASSLYDAVFLAATRLKNARNLKKALLLISDGYDTSSTHSYNQMRDHLRTFDAQIYAIGIADPALDQFAGYRRWFFEDITRQGALRSVQKSPEIASGRAVLAEMSRASGGTTYLPETDSESELAFVCSQIASELRQQYTLAFYSSATSSNGWRKLKVRIGGSQASSNLRLSYRKGYQLTPDQ
ncbi:MAG TPA: VWA domain-containing protein [Pyrinomonadaceae bacterium]|nr:VWA domain-containing protein [Pyrinomonadaceae bacterium]